MRPLVAPTLLAQFVSCVGKLCLQGFKGIDGSVQMVAQRDRRFPFVSVRPLCIFFKCLYQFSVHNPSLLIHKPSPSNRLVCAVCAAKRSSCALKESSL